MKWKLGHNSEIEGEKNIIMSTSTFGVMLRKNDNWSIDLIWTITLTESRWIVSSNGLFFFYQVSSNGLNVT
jgi:hypothetical protein